MSQKPQQTFVTTKIVMEITLYCDIKEAIMEIML